MSTWCRETQKGCKYFARRAKPLISPPRAPLQLCCPTEVALQEPFVELCFLWVGVSRGTVPGRQVTQTAAAGRSVESHSYQGFIPLPKCCGKTMIGHSPHPTRRKVVVFLANSQFNWMFKGAEQLCAKWKRQSMLLTWELGGLKKAK